MKITNFIFMTFLSALSYACSDSAPPPPQSANVEELNGEDEFGDEEELDEQDIEVIETQDLNPRQVTNGLEDEVRTAIDAFLGQADLGLLESHIPQDRVAEFQDYLDRENADIQTPDGKTLAVAITYLLEKKLKANDSDSPPAEEATVAPEDSGSVVDNTVAAATNQIFRLYSSGAKDHMFSADKNEAASSYDYQMGKGFRLFPNPAAGRKPIYRCISEATGNHFLADNQNCDGDAYKMEGLLGYALAASTSGAVEMHRCYNNSRTDTLTTSNQSECTSGGYSKQKTIGYAFPE